MKNIVLIGIMGCGKTTVSLLLAEKLARPVIDIDEYLEKKYQCQFQKCLLYQKLILEKEKQSVVRKF